MNSEEIDDIQTFIHRMSYINGDDQQLARQAAFIDLARYLDAKRAKNGNLRESTKPIEVPCVTRNQVLSMADVGRIESRTPESRGDYANIWFCDCSSNDFLAFNRDIKIEHGTYKMLYIEGGSVTSYHPVTAALHLSSVTAELVRLGPNSKLWTNGVDGENTVCKFERCVLEGHAVSINSTDIKSLTVLFGGQANLCESVAVNDVSVYGTLVIEDSSVTIKGPITLKPGGVVMFQEEEESPHLDVITERTRFVERTKLLFKNYTRIVG